MGKSITKMHEIGISTKFSLFSFFAISGYLATVTLINDPSRVIEIQSNNLFKNAQLFGKFVLQRYVRLTPLFALTIMISDMAASLLSNVSVYSQHFRDDMICPQ